MCFVYRLKCSVTGKVYYGSCKRKKYEYRQMTGYDDCSCKDFINPEVLICLDNLDENIYKLVEEWYIQNNECVNKMGKYTNLSKKEYTKLDNDRSYKKNREQILKYKRQHRYDTIDYRREKINCKKCNSIVSRENMTKHQKTKKCSVKSLKF
mgnify:CR=1 FL=1